MAKRPREISEPVESETPEIQELRRLKGELHKGIFRPGVNGDLKAKGPHALAKIESALRRASELSPDEVAQLTREGRDILASDETSRETGPKAEDPLASGEKGRSRKKRKGSSSGGSLLATPRPADVGSFPQTVEDAAIVTDEVPADDGPETPAGTEGEALSETHETEGLPRLDHLEEMIQTQLSSPIPGILSRAIHIRKELSHLEDTPPAERAEAVRGYYALMNAAHDVTDLAENLGRMSGIIRGIEDERAGGEEGPESRRLLSALGINGERDRQEFDALYQDVQDVMRDFELETPDALSTRLSGIQRRGRRFLRAWRSSEASKQAALDGADDAEAAPVKAAENAGPAAAPVVEGPAPEADAEPPADPAKAEGAEAVERKVPFQVGDSVRVRRSSGEIDTGWIITHLDDGIPFIFVQKGEGKESKRKRIPRSELEELNPPSSPVAAAGGAETEPHVDVAGADALLKEMSRENATENPEIPPLTEDERRDVEYLRDGLNMFLRVYSSERFASVRNRLTELGSRIDEIERLQAPARADRLKEAEAIIGATDALNRRLIFLDDRHGVFELLARREEMSPEDFQAELLKAHIDGEEELAVLVKMKATVDDLLPRFQTASLEELQDATSTLESSQMLEFIEHVRDRENPIVSPEARAEIKKVLDEIQRLHEVMPDEVRSDPDIQDVDLERLLQIGFEDIGDPNLRSDPDRFARRIEELKEILQKATEVYKRHADSSARTLGEGVLGGDAELDFGTDGSEGEVAGDPLDAIGSEAGAVAGDAKAKIADILSRFEEGLRESSQLEGFFSGLTLDSLNDLPALETKFKTIFSPELLATLGVEDSVKDEVSGRYWGVFLESVTDRVRFAVAQMEQQNRMKQEVKYAGKTFVAGATFAGVRLGVGALGARFGVRVLADFLGAAPVAAMIGGVAGGVHAALSWSVSRTPGQEKELAELLEKLNSADAPTKEGIMASLKEDMTAIMASDQHREESLKEMSAYLTYLEGLGPDDCPLNEWQINDFRRLLELTRLGQQREKSPERNSERHELIKKMLDNGTISKWTYHYGGGVTMRTAITAFEAEVGRPPEESEIALLQQHIALAAERDMNALLGDVVAQEQAEMMEGSKSYLETYTDKLLGREHPETFMQAVLVGAASGAVSGAISSSATAGAIYMGARRFESTARSEILKNTHEVKTAREVESDLDTLLRETQALGGAEPLDAREFDSRIRAAIEDARTRVKLPDMKEADRARIERRILDLQNAWIQKSVLLEMRSDPFSTWEAKFEGYVASVEKAQEMAKKEKSSKKWFGGGWRLFQEGLIGRYRRLSGEEKKKVLGMTVVRTAEGAVLGLAGGAAVDFGVAQYEDPDSFFHRHIGDQKDVADSEPGSAAPGAADSTRGAAPRDSGGAGPETPPADHALAAAQQEFQGAVNAHGLSPEEQRLFAPAEQTLEALRQAAETIDAYDKGFDKLGFTDETRAQFAEDHPRVAAEMADDPRQLDVAHNVLTRTNLPDSQIDDIVMAHPEVLANPDSVSEIMAKLETAGVAPEVAATMLTESHDNLAALTPAEQHGFVREAVLNTHPGLKEAGYTVDVDETGKAAVSVELGKGEAIGSREDAFAQLAAERMDAEDLLNEKGELSEIGAAKLLNVANNLNELLEGRGMESFRESFDRAGVTFENGVLHIDNLAAFEETLQALRDHADTIEDTLAHGAVASTDNKASGTWKTVLTLHERAAGHEITVSDFGKSEMVTRAEQEIGSALVHSAVGDGAENVHVLDEDSATFTHHGAPVEIHGGHITSYDSLPMDVDASGGVEAVNEGVFSAQVAHEVEGLDADSDSMEELAQELHGSREPLTGDERGMVHAMAENHISADDVRENGEIQRPLVELVASEHLTSEQAGAVRDTHELMSEHLEADIPYRNIHGMMEQGLRVEHPDGVEGVVVANPATRDAVHLSPAAGDAVRATYLPEYTSGAAFDESKEVESPLTHEPIGRDLKEHGVDENSLKGVAREIPAQAEREAGVVENIADAAKDRAIFDKFARDLKPEEVDKLLNLPAGAFDLDYEGASDAEVNRVAKEVGTNQTDDVREVVRVMKGELGRMDWHRDADPIRDVLQFKIEQDVHAPVEASAAAPSAEAAAHDDHEHTHAEPAPQPKAESVETAPQPAPEPAEPTPTPEPTPSPAEAAPPSPEPQAAGPETPPAPETEGPAADRENAYALLTESLQDEKGNALKADEITALIQSDDSAARAGLMMHLEAMIRNIHDNPDYETSEEMQSTLNGLDQILWDLREHSGSEAPDAPEAATEAAPETAPAPSARLESVAVQGGRVQFEYAPDGRVVHATPEVTTSGPPESLNDNYQNTVIERAAAASKGGLRTVDLDIDSLKHDAKEIDLYRDALSQLENDGKGDSREASYLRREIGGRILHLEKKYGDVFKD